MAASCVEIQVPLIDLWNGLDMASLLWIQIILKNCLWTTDHLNSWNLLTIKGVIFEYLKSCVLNGWVRTRRKEIIESFKLQPNDGEFVIINGFHILSSFVSNYAIIDYMNKEMPYSIIWNSGFSCIFRRKHKQLLQPNAHRCRHKWVQYIIHWNLIRLT